MKRRRVNGRWHDDRRQQAEGEHHREPDLGAGRGEEPPERRRQRHDDPRPHEQEGQACQHRQLVHRMNSGRRLMMSVEKLLITRSIHGNVRANTPKIAAERGMNASTLS